MSVTKDAYRRYVATMRNLSVQAHNELMALWPLLDKTDPETLRRTLEQCVPAIIDIYGNASSVISAAFYDVFRDASGAKGAYVARTVAPNTADKAMRTVGWALSDEFDGESPTSAISGALDEAVKGWGRATIAENALSDPWAMGYQSIPDADACAFCYMKAIATYYSYNGQRLDATVDSDAWHPHCNCQLVPVFEECPEWAQLARVEEMYDDARKLAMDNGWDSDGKLSTKAVMKAMREANGLKH